MHKFGDEFAPGPRYLEYVPVIAAAAERAQVSRGLLQTHADHNDAALWEHLPHLIIVATAFVGFMTYLWWDGRRARAGHRDEPGERTDVRRLLTVTLLCVAALAHIPVTAEHLREAPYMGALFIGFVVAALLIAGALTIGSTVLRYAMAGGLCVAAVAAYVATRLIAFPQLGDDVGAWWEPFGVICIVTESVVVVMATLEVRRLTTSARRRPSVVTP